MASTPARIGICNAGLLVTWTARSGHPREGERDISGESYPRKEHFCERGTLVCQHSITRKKLSGRSPYPISGSDAIYGPRQPTPNPRTPSRRIPLRNHNALPRTPRPLFQASHWPSHQPQVDYIISNLAPIAQPYNRTYASATPYPRPVSPPHLYPTGLPNRHHRPRQASAQLKPVPFVSLPPPTAPEETLRTTTGWTDKRAARPGFSG